MSANARLKDVSLAGLDIAILGNSDPNNVIQYYSLCNIKSIESVYTPAPPSYFYPNVLKIVIHYTDNQSQVAKLDFDIQDVQNQAGWTADQAGLTQAVADLNSWRASACGASSINDNLELILAELSDDADIEDTIVRDTVSQKLYILERSRDQNTGAITQKYYDVDGVQFTPTNPMEIVQTSTIGLATEATLSSLVNQWDVPAVGTEKGIVPLGVRNDGLAANFTSTDGDLSPMAISDAGEVFTSDTGTQGLLSSIQLEIMSINDALHPASDNSATPDAHDSSALDNEQIIKASAGVLYGISGYNNGPDQFIQIHNAVAVPANGAVTPLVIFKVAAGQNFFWTPPSPLYGKYFSTGISINNSTNAAPFIKTLGAADCTFNVDYK